MYGATFVKSAARKEDYPKKVLPKIAFIGRSNVGKSSLINCLVGQKNLARTSSRPGRTQVLNFFEVAGRFYLVDLPGYGFAKVPEQIRSRWGPMIEEFLRSDSQLCLAVLIVDIRRRLTALDRIMVDWLGQYRIPAQLVATKTDKLSPNRLREALEKLGQEVGVGRPLPFSAVTALGRRELWLRIEDSAKEMGGRF